MRAVVYIRSAFALVCALAAPARAQGGTCGETAWIMAGLLEKYHEVPIWRGVAGEIEFIVTADPEGGTWTLVSIEPDGRACMRAAGEAWNIPTQPAEGDPT